MKITFKNDEELDDFLVDYEGILVAVPKEPFEYSPADLYILGKCWENEKIIYNLIGYNEEDGCLRGLSSSNISKGKLQACWFFNYDLYKFDSLPEFCTWYLTQAGYTVTKNKAEATTETYIKKEQAREELHELNKELVYKDIHDTTTDKVLQKEIENVYPYITKPVKKITRREKYEDIIKIIDFNTEFILNRVSDNPSKCLSIYDSLQEFLEGEVEE